MQNLDSIIDQLHQLKRETNTTYSDLAAALVISRKSAHSTHHGGCSLESLTIVADFYGLDLAVDGVTTPCVGKALQSLRLAQGRSIGDVARASKVSNAAIKRVERGFDQVRLTTVAKVADALGATLSLVKAETPVRRARDELRAWNAERRVPDDFFIFDNIIAEQLAERVALYEARANR